MNKINTNDTNSTENRSAWMHLPEGKAFLLAACLGLGTISQPALGQLQFSQQWGQAANCTGATNNWGYSLNYGKDYAGVYGSFNVGAINRRKLERFFNANEKGYSEASAKASVGMKFVDQRIEVAGFRYELQNDSGTTRLGPTNQLCSGSFFGVNVSTSAPIRPWYCYRSFRVLGYTLDEGTTTQSYTAEKRYNKTFWSGSGTCVLGVVPCTIAGSIGGGASYSYGLQLNANGVGMWAEPKVWMSGTACGGLGLFGCGVGPYLSADLATTSFRPELTVTPTTISGQANLNVQPISIEVDLAAVFVAGEKVAGGLPVYWESDPLTYPLITPFTSVNNACLPATPPTSANNARLPAPVRGTVVRLPR